MLDMTPGEVAAHLNVSAPTVRRMAAAYEAVIGPLPRQEGRHSRLWPVEAVRQVQAAHQALGTGRVTSLERALELVRDGAELPERIVLPVAPDVLAGLVAEIRALRLVVEGQAAELTALRELVQGRELPPPSGAHLPLDLPSLAVQEVVQAAVKVALNPERLRVALHAAEPPAVPAPRRGLLARLVVGFFGAFPATDRER